MALVEDKERGRSIFWIFWFGCIGLLGYVLWENGWLEAFATYNIIAVSWISIVVIGGVFLFFEIVLACLFAFRRRNVLTDSESSLNAYATRERTLCVIPFQDQDHEALVKGVESAVNTFAHVYLIGEEKNRDKIMEIALSFNVHHSCFSGITVTEAIYQTVKQFWIEHPSMSFTVVTDGMTVFDSNFFVRADLFTADYFLAAYSPNIKTTGSVFDAELCANSYISSLSGFYHSVDECSKHCVIFRSDRLVMTYYESPTKTEFQFVGEQKFIGQFVKLFDMRSAHDDLNTVTTAIPNRSLIGKKSTLKERIMETHINFLRVLQQDLYLFVCYSTGFILCSLLYRFEYLRKLIYSLTLMLWPVVIVQSIVVGGGSWSFWVLLHAALYMVGLITICVRSFFMNRMSLQGVLLYPLLMTADSLCSFASLLVAVFWYVPFVRRWLRRPWKEGLAAVGDIHAQADGIQLAEA
eukprot:TRINITY_DN168_c0_g2_i1.p1 TRINITY_DN168_c0_g2~~TRINITY_DN168_c0_g2_i1.p1  ORF type:complete len:477 (+),score=129.70 TRINITY_DN168_c0_g2_i1:36-1433(+)